VTNQVFIWQSCIHLTVTPSVLPAVIAYSPVASGEVSVVSQCECKHVSSSLHWKRDEVHLSYTETNWSLHHTCSWLQVCKGCMQSLCDTPSTGTRGLDTVEVRTGQWSPQGVCLRDSSLASAPLRVPMRAQRVASNSATILNISPLLCVCRSLNKPARVCCVQCVFVSCTLVS
jgi:hypothetical protein